MPIKMHINAETKQVAVIEAENGRAKSFKLGSPKKLKKRGLTKMI